jgi:hypothetical protein
MKEWHESNHDHKKESASTWFMASLNCNHESNLRGSLMAVLHAFTSLFFVGLLGGFMFYNLC